MVEWVKLVRLSYFLICLKVFAEPQPLLVGGEFDRMGTFDSVLVFSTENERLEERCTGTKVAKGLILTAAHCFVDDGDSKPGMTIQRPKNVKKIFYSFSTFVTEPKLVKEIRVKRVRLHPALEKCFSKPHQEVSNCIDKAPDLAVIELDQSEHFSRQSLATLGTHSVQVGEQVFVVGFGAQGINDHNPPARKYHLSQVVSLEELAKTHGGVSQEELEVYQKLYFGTLGVLMGNNYANLGAGDSGGPVFTIQDKQAKLVGINSFSFCPDDDSECEITSNSYFSRIHVGSPLQLGEWISGLIKAAH